MKSTIDQLIINSPYEEPKHYWSYNRETRAFALKTGRRPAGYLVASEKSKGFDDPGVFIEIPQVNQIRPRVVKWREAGYPGVTGITKRLLVHWHNSEERELRLFFCQLEAIETLIWIAEAPDADKVGIDVPSDGGLFKRLCSKMATGSGKTIVMAMLIAWHVLNKVTYPQDTRFSKHIFIVAPGLTVKSRLQVLVPASAGNYYDVFNIVPQGLHEKLRQGKVFIRNWHALNWETEEQIAKKKGVDKRGAKSNEAYVREVLGEMEKARNIVVINDEAHHAWRIPAESKVKGVRKEDIEQATKWVGGLDRIQDTRGILACYDFSATPLAPSGKQRSEEALFDWIISDFGLNDAIESGLVKTPRVVIRDDGRLTTEYKSRFFHLYNDSDVKDDLNRKAEEYETLPDLVINGFYLLGKDWLETTKAWKEASFKTPPVMITVANRVETAARVEYAFVHNKIHIDELCIPERILHIDSKVLETAESQEEAVYLNGSVDEATEEDVPIRKLSKKELAELLRKTVDTVGQVGQPGEQIQKVISVGMLSEGWDTKTVTHVMGLRAFTSQLLCEQVVGSMNKVVQHIWEAIRFENTESIEPVFDSDNPIRSTGGMRPWYTGKPCEKTKRSHINFCVFDSTWEASEAFELDRNHNVEAWVKNDHLGFEILYIFKGVVRKYRPDFIIRLKTGKFLILETKGQETERDKTKREFLDEWVRAVNEHGGFGTWQGAVSKNPADVAGILEKEASN